MKTLIQAVEIWTPDADAQLLELQAGLYGDAKAFERLSRAMCFGRGEGLPGRVWQQGHPILLKDLEGGYFRRAAAARKAGLTAAVALPVYGGELFKAVVVLFCGDAQGDAGAIELWRNDPRVTPDMTLVDGYYGGHAQHAAQLAAASHDTFLPRGTGLPGLAWQRQASVFMDDLGDPSKFVRFQEAVATGMRRGLAIPCPVPGRENFAVTILSNATRPFARQVESWVPAPDAVGGLRRESGFNEAEGKLSTALLSKASSDREQAILDAFATGAPRLQPASGTEADGATGLLALPIHDDDSVTEVLALYL